MKKRNILLSVLLVLVAASSIYVGSTYAKYISTYSGSSAVEIAKWDVAVNGQDLAATAITSQTLPCTFVPTSVSTVVDGKIAPGRSCYIDVTINPDKTEVAVDYQVIFGNALNGTLPTNIAKSAKKSSGTTFNADNATEVTLGGGGDTDGTIALHDSSTALAATDSITLRYELSWPYETTDGNDEDTNDGITAATLSIPVTVTLSQSAVVE